MLAQRLAAVPWLGPRLLIRLHRQGYGLEELSWSQFADRVVQQRPDAVTVDVFDTCIVRDLAGDESIEHVIEYRVGRQPDSQSADSQWIEEAAALEVEMCRPVAGARAALAKIRSVVGGVTFISDTERSSELLQQILTGFDLFEDGDRMVASCEEGATKSDGPLYDLIWQNRPEVVWHAGNNDWSDGVMAAAKGYHPFIISDGNLSRYEEAMSHRARSVGPALASASRAARLELEEERRVGLVSDREYQLQLMGTQVAGPAMAAFALWIGEQCRQHDIGHVGYLARDGELPMLMSKAMSEDHLGPVSSSYLHCNRLIVTLASASTVGVEQWLRDGTASDDAFLEVNRHIVPLSLLLSRIGFDLQDVADVLGVSHPLARLSADKPLGSENVAHWHELLFDQTAAKLIQSRSVGRRDLLLDHVRSHGIGQERLALVDVGWRGRLAWLLSSVLRDYLGHEPLHLHFGGDKVFPGLEDGVQIRRFAFDGVSPPDPLDSPVSTVETITASGKARVVDYSRGPGGEVQLVYEQGPADLGLEFRSEMWRGATRMAASVPSRKTLSEWGVSNAALDSEVRATLGAWWNQPTRLEAEALASLGFEHDEAGTTVRPVVAPYRLTDIVGSRQPRQWSQGSEAVSSPASRAGMRLVRLTRRLRDRKGSEAGRSA